MACWESREARVTRQSAQRRGAGRGKQSLGLAGHSGPGHGESSQIRGLFLQCLCTAVLNVLSGPRVGDPPPSREGPQIPPPHLPGPAITGSPATKTLPNPAGLGWLEEFSEIQRRDRASRVASAGLWSSGSRRLGRGARPDPCGQRKRVYETTRMQPRPTTAAGVSASDGWSPAANHVRRHGVSLPAFHLRESSRPKTPSPFEVELARMQFHKRQRLSD